jgi:ATP-binding cassette subfamily B protein
MKIDVRDWKIIWFFYKPYKFKFTFLLALMFFSGLFEALNLSSLYLIINYGLHLEKKDFFLKSFERITPYLIPANPFLSACIVLIIISVLAVALKLYYTYFFNKLSTQIIGDIQKKIFDKLLSTHYEFYIKSQQGKLVYAGTTATQLMADVVFYTITFIYQALNSIFLFFLLLALSWKATLFILLLGVFYAVVVRSIMHKYINKSALIKMQESQNKNIILNELITGIKTIKVFAVQNEWKKRYGRAVDGMLNSIFRMGVSSVFPETFIKFLFYILIALTGTIFSQKSNLEIVALLPVLGTFVLVVNRFFPSINVLGSSMMQVAGGMPGAKIIYELCREEFPVEPDGNQYLQEFKDKINFENVWFKYNNMDDYLLKDLSFSLERRKMTAIVGLSGSGKTTIINLLLKLYSVDRGAIKIDGINISDLKNKSYLSHIGYVSQETFIFNNTIKENIRFGMENSTDQMIEEAAKLANAHDFIIETSHGYDTIVGDSGIKLSGGQRQRIAIARAMLRDPEIIVLDEATSSLDNISENKIQKAINNISKHATVLVIAHRLSTVQNADKIIILGKGEIKEQGTHEELMRNKNLYYELHMSRDVNDSKVVYEDTEEVKDNGYEIK